MRFTILSRNQKMDAGKVKIKSKNWKEWVDAQTIEVLGIAENFVLSRAETDTQSEILQTAFTGFRRQVSEWLLPNADSDQPVLLKVNVSEEFPVF